MSHIRHINIMLITKSYIRTLQFSTLHHIFISYNEWQMIQIILLRVKKEN